MLTPLALRCVHEGPVKCIVHCLDDLLYTLRVKIAESRTQPLSSDVGRLNHLFFARCAYAEVFSLSRRALCWQVRETNSVHPVLNCSSIYCFFDSFFTCAWHRPCDVFCKLVPPRLAKFFLETLYSGISSRIDNALRNCRRYLSAPNLSTEWHIIMHKSFKFIFNTADL